MNPSFARPLLPLVLVAAVALSGCQIIPTAQPDPTRFYVLSVPAIATTLEAVPPEQQVRLGLLTLDVAAYLAASKSLIVRRGANEITYLTYDRWAEGLGAGASRLINRRLTASARVAGVETYPFTGEVARDYDLALRLDRCEGRLAADGTASAEVGLTYEIIATADGAVVASGTLTPPAISWDGRDAEALAAALSQAVVDAASGLVAVLPFKP